MSRLALCVLCAAAVASVRAFESAQFFRPERYSRGDTNVRPLQAIDSAAWIGLGDMSLAARETFDTVHAFDADDTGTFIRFRKRFESDGSALRFDVSADERHVLLIDGEIVSRGPHRGLPAHWYYQSYEVKNLAAGGHVMEAVVTRLGAHAPLAQLSWRGGSFILKAEGVYDAELTTGKAVWLAAPLENTKMTGAGKSRTFGAGSACEIIGTSFLNEIPDESRLRAAVIVRRPVTATKYGIRTEGWQLFPTERPDQISRRISPGRIVSPQGGIDKTVPPNEKREYLWDLENYYCGYPELRTKGGKSARVTWGWTESLRDRNGKKGNRDEYIGKNAEQALTDVFIADGRGDALFTAPWWRCGRWCRLTVETADEPLEIVSAAILETRYPLEDEGGFDCDDPSVAPIRSMCLRTLQMCAHEMFFDCPYYEQQMYGGDTRVEILYLSSVTRDDRLARFAMSVFDYDRRSDGIVAMNFPTRGTQESSTYTMCWITMFRDYAYRGTNAAWLKSRLPGARNAMEGLALYENGDGFLEHLPGWSFVDWAPEYDNGVPGQGVVNFQYLYTLKLLAETEEALGETAYAKIWRAKAERLAAKLQETLWDEKRGMMADEAAGRRFSEHAQCLAILSGMFPEDLCGRMFEGLTGAKDLVRTSLYFSHYLFETYFRFGRADLFFARLAVWKDQLAHGLKTAMETPRLESRSDCHAWSSGPLYALQAGVAGISPAAPFYRKVRVAPQPAHLKRIGCKAPHPDGFVEVNLDFSAGTADGAVSLPAGVTGVFEWKGVKTALKGGANVIGRGTRAGHKGLTDGS